MRPDYVKALIAVVWFFVICAAGRSSTVMSAYAWAVVALLAVLPPCVMMCFWNEPPHTNAETIPGSTSLTPRN